MSYMNRLANCHNRYQGDAKRVLCVCSAGLLRSPTTAWVLGQEPYNYNTRAAGLSTEYALIPVDDVLIKWADEVVCMDIYQADELKERFGVENPKVLSIPDMFRYKDETLIRMIKENYDALE